MKKINLFIAFIAIVLSAVISNSCKKEYAEPTVSWDGSISKIIDFENVSNWGLDLNITFTAEAGIEDIQIKKIIYQGLDEIEVSMPSPTGFEGLTSFEYNFVVNHTLNDFTGGVTKIVYEFVVKDKEGQEGSADYTLFVIEAYNLTFIVKDGFNNPINDAVITFNGITNDAGIYIFEYIEPGTYEYEVVREGYETVSVTDFVMPESNTTVTVEMITKLSNWSDDIVLALSSQVSWATYNGVLVGQYQSTDLGMAYTYTNTGIGRIVTTSNCVGFVVMDNNTITSYDALVDAYNNGDAVTQYDLNVDEIRAYQEKYFAVKFTDGTYKLVWYKFGHRSPTTGNILGFAYKTKA